jgi:hypothetical protein
MYKEDIVMYGYLCKGCRVPRRECGYVSPGRNVSERESATTAAQSKSLGLLHLKSISRLLHNILEGRYLPPPPDLSVSLSNS